MTQIIQIGMVPCADESEWTFMFYDGNLMQFSHSDGENQISISTLEALPFVEVLLYTFEFDVDDAYQELEANQFDAAAEAAFKATKQRVVETE